ncbi:hypothetical protein GWN63_04965 [Candidatus Bathyarchaeota archaeon]|nr:hypothetical protein [Candidatus Bathyarchaeota archaeon]NIU81577.1 hypothetical protein [Candidatus Bathyarchaeota archaeon]NIV68219.1 hypothetical protein [Candidatus Bathyarchaeota archaeon]NIW16475.1 hypothetical protein [Candidatus Bathyarchaeota archaeon]NIW34749.1 hypothetical protein [Candidatus Bathyarchaeota archaeon]
MFAILVTASILLIYCDPYLAYSASPPNCNDTVCYVDLHNNYFDPEDITIRPPNTDTGENVTLIWENLGSFTHTITSGTRDSPDGIFDRVLEPGDSFELQMNQSMHDQLLTEYLSETIPYYCRFHPGMEGTLTISGTPIPEFTTSTLLLGFILVSGSLLFILHACKMEGDE